MYTDLSLAALRRATILMASAKEVMPTVSWEKVLGYMYLSPELEKNSPQIMSHRGVAGSRLWSTSLWLVSIQFCHYSYPHQDLSIQ